MQPVIFLLCVGTSLGAGNVWRTKHPVSIGPTEGAGLTPLPPVGRRAEGIPTKSCRGPELVSHVSSGPDETVRRRQPESPEESDGDGRSVY